ncbi:late endosomal/lysosomal adaptor and MAPK and MTOR activator-domain-containing protein [Podospora conica]|nr:late endosomal/lysosomal adaptor and MAPK and MTOR activator-domain-containing protein [Schizothecium conicum]
MGNCTSCLGYRRRESIDEEDEAQNLFGDPASINYGSFDQQHMPTHEDPQEVQREIEALQRVVARTSDNLVDIYDIVPQDEAVHADDATTYAYVADEPHMARYQTLLSKLSSHDDLHSVARVDWGTPEDDTIEMQQSVVPIKIEGTDALVGNFTDAAAAMR